MKNMKYKNKKMTTVKIFPLIVLPLILLTQFKWNENYIEKVGFVEKTSEVIVNNDEYYVRNGKYENSDYMFNVELHNQDSSNLKVMDFNKISGTKEEKESEGVLWFDDNGEVGDGNEMEYSPVATIYFAPNIDYIEDINVSFEIEDHYREVSAAGYFSSQKESSAKKVNLSSLSIPSETEGELTTGSSSSYADHIYFDRFGSNSNKYADFPFRLTYHDSPLMSSDYLTIYEKNPNQLSTGHDTSEGWGHGYIDEGYVGTDGNKDIFIKNSLKVTFTPYYDTPVLSEYSFDRMQFAIDLINNSEIDLNKKTYSFNSLEDEYQISNGEYDLVKYSFDDIGYEEILFGWSKFINILSVGESDSFISRYITYENENKNLSRKLSNDDFVIKFGNNLEGKLYVRDDFSEQLSKTNTPIENSNVKLSIELNPDNNDYGDTVIYDLGEESNDYGYFKENGSMQQIISLNLPFYNWEFEEISLDNNHKTAFGQETKFYIPDIKMEEKLFSKSYSVDVYTNSNLRFYINDDSNVSSVKQNGVNINQYKDNSFKIETNFDEGSEASTTPQSETVTIYYNNLITDPNYDGEVAQSINVNFYYDSDSPINNSTTEVIENIGDNSSNVSSNVLMATKDEEAITQEDKEFELIDYYQIYKNAQFNLSNSEANEILNLDMSIDIDDDSASDELNYEYIENVDRYTPVNNDGVYSLQKEDYQYLDYSNTVQFSESGLYNWKIRTKWNDEYSYWIMVSDSYVDYNEDDGLTSNNSFPSEWNQLKGEIIGYNSDEEYYIVNVNDESLYIKSFMETETGNLLAEKGKKKGWTKSGLSKEPSYSVLKLLDSWDQLKDFTNLKIDPESVSETTSALKEKDKNKFKDVQPYLENEINAQLKGEANNLSYSDYEIKYYNVDGIEIPNNKIIKNDDLIKIKIESSKYGSGINDYEFEIQTRMIEPTPLWITATITLSILAIVLFAFIFIFSLIERRKNIKIRG